MFSSLKVVRWAFPASAIALTLGLISCGPTAPTAGGPGAGGGTSPTAAPAAAGGGGQAVRLNGAGASAPAPVYQRWFSEYNKQNPATQVNYQSVGSGAGINQFVNQTVDFGATDAPLKEEERKKYPTARGTGPIQIPTTGLFIVFAHNLEGVDKLTLSREAYCGIVDGSITTWNDAKIAAANKGVNLPNTPIAFIHRSDGSGTTDIFTKHVEKACPNWTRGSGKSVEWPTGTGAKGNEGVTAQIQQIPGGVGYVEYSYAKENKLKMASLQNKAGDIVEPTPENAAKALEGAEIPADFAVKIPDPEQKGAYPIVSLTYVLLYERYDNPATAEALKSLWNWALKDGKQFASELGYIPLPDDVVSRVATAVNGIQVAAK